MNFRLLRMTIVKALNYHVTTNVGLGGLVTPDDSVNSIWVWGLTHTHNAERARGGLGTNM